MKMGKRKRIDDDDDDYFKIDDYNITNLSSLIKLIHDLINKNPPPKKFKKRLDPRLYNGAILLGLETPVIKSHGSTDYIGFANSIDVCVKTVFGQLIDKIKKNINN